MYFQFRIIIAILFLNFISTSFTGSYNTFAQNKKKTSQNAQTTFKIKKGINVSHYLAITQHKSIEERLNWFNENDVKYIKSVGFDHIRLPVDEATLFDKDGLPLKPNFNLLRRTIGWCEKANLKVIVELHTLQNYSFSMYGSRPIWNFKEGEEAFISRWKAISKELKYFPNSLLAYELMNEPVAPADSAWNKLAQRSLKALRKVEPERFIVIGSNYWQVAERIPALTPTFENDKKIILSYHFYTPMPLTHYMANWIGALGNYVGPVHYPGQVVEEKDLSNSDFYKPIKEAVMNHNGVFNIDSLEKRMMPAILSAKEKGLSLYCGEFGCLNFAPEADRLRWYSDVLSILKKHDISYAVWDYKGRFGIVDDKNKVDINLVNTLFPKP